MAGAPEGSVIAPPLKVWVEAPVGVTESLWIEPEQIVATSGVRQVQDETVTVWLLHGPGAGAQPPSPRT